MKFLHEPGFSVTNISLDTAEAHIFPIKFLLIL